MSRVQGEEAAGWERGGHLAGGDEAPYSIHISWRDTAAFTIHISSLHPFSRSLALFLSFLLLLLSLALFFSPSLSFSLRFLDHWRRRSLPWRISICWSRLPRAPRQRQSKGESSRWGSRESSTCSSISPFQFNSQALRFFPLSYLSFAPNTRGTGLNKHKKSELNDSSQPAKVAGC